MKFKEIIYNASTTIELNRVASAYVIDYSRLNSEEVIDALLKTAPQYSHLGNVKQAIETMNLHKDRNTRVLGMLILKTLLLNADDFMSSHQDTENDVLAYEQKVIRESAQDAISKIKMKGIITIYFNLLLRLLGKIIMRFHLMKKI